MKRILFICHGNICRSPMAEFIMKELVRLAGVSDSFEIASAATSYEEVGNPVYPPVKKLLNGRGISCDGKYAVVMSSSDYDRYDMIVCMDNRNYRNLMRIIGTDPEKKVSLLLDHTERPGEIDDPWYSGDFETVEKQIECGCRALLSKLLN